MLNNEGIETSHFKNHVATLGPFSNISGEKIQRLLWKEPDTGICRIEYLLKDGLLIVTGDLGHAIYWWSDPRCSFEWLSKTGLGYFSSKCEASEAGRRYSEWDPKAVEQWIEEKEKDLLADYAEDDEKGVMAAWKELKEHLEGSGDSQADWHEALANYHDPEGREKALGDEWYEGLDAGKTTHARCYLHWKGIQMAMAQLELLAPIDKL